MDATYVAAALASALLHASWNAAVKASPAPTRAMTAQMLLSGLPLLPALFWVGLPDAAAWPWIAGSTCLNVLTVAALLRAYALGAFGVIYPVVRAVAVLLVVPLAAVLAGERIGLGALGGVLVVVASLGVLAFDAARDRRIAGGALGWALVAGVGTAACVMCDAQGVRAAGSPLAYGLVVSATNAAAMWWRRRDDGPPWTGMAGQWRLVVPVAVASTASYLLILWVFARAPIAPAAALRDTSAIFAILIAVVWLRERFTAMRMLAVLLTSAAVPLLRLG